MPPDYMKDIKDFHEKFGLAYAGPPRTLPNELRDFRLRFMDEELYEYCQATSFVKELDALVDLVYVVMGTAHLHGFNFDEAWRRVHEANMKKIRVNKETLEGSIRKSEYDVVKPEGWEPPFLDDLVRPAGDVA